MKRRMGSAMLRCWLGAMLALCAGDAKAFGAETPQAGGGELKYERPRLLTGTIYKSGSKQLLFKFTRQVTRSGSTLKVQRDFDNPDGKPAARERIVYEGDELMSYALEELQIGATGSARFRRARAKPGKGSIEFEYAAEPRGRPKARTEVLQENILVADMVGPFLGGQWERLRRGEKVRCRYIVVPRMETVGFTFAKESETVWQGREVLIIRMGASSPIIAALVDPLYFTVEKAPPHRVFQYAGRTTPKVLAAGKWKDLDAVTVFDWDSAP